MDKVYLTAVICVTLLILSITYMAYDIRKRRIEYAYREMRTKALLKADIAEQVQLSRLIEPVPVAEAEHRKPDPAQAKAPAAKPDPAPQPEAGRKGKIKGYYCSDDAVTLMER